ncbi:signal peptidase I [Streptomyces sp. NPDC059002]|uniref:signal peptidase I n=1 Tax=Streptomyces sp. NPDC059002 TaxID=3346690 RepID=UPI00369331F3
MTPRRTVRVLVATAVTSAITTVVVIGAALWWTGARLVPVLTGSMAPHHPAGALLVTKPLDAHEIRQGDVVLFPPPAAHRIDDKPVVHRVDTIQDTGGTRVMTTKGDANPTPDPWQIDLATGEYHTPVLTIPHAGALVGGLRWAGPALIVLAGLVLVAATIRTTLPRNLLRPPGKPQ